MGHRSQGILGFVGLVAICAGLGYGAWKGLTTRPGARPAARRVAPAQDSVGFVSVAGEGVDLEVIGPSGARTTTTGSVGTGRIAGSESSVDCPGFADAHGKEADCTASVTISTPPPGDYTIVVHATALRGVTLNVGWATASEYKRGGFDVRVQVAAGGATAFTIVVGRDAVSQRSEPRAVTP